MRRWRSPRGPAVPRRSPTRSPSRWNAVEGPDAAGEGLAVADRLISLGEQIGDKELVYAGHDHRLHAFWLLADRAGVDVELDGLATLTDELRQPAQRWLLGTCRTMLALTEGRFEHAEALIGETLALGRRAASWNADVSYRIGLFVLRREQGRLAELEPLVGRSVHEYPALLRFRCAQAHIHAALGREPDARAVLGDLLSRDLADEHVDAEWLFSVCLLPDVCAFLGDERAAAGLYGLLLPYERLYASAPVEATFGSVARALGALATVLRRFDDAERHLDAAIAIERRMGGRPWLAHAQHDLAAMLLARGDPAGRARARALLEDAAGAYAELGMGAWAARAMALQNTAA